MLQGQPYFKPYQLSGHIFTKGEREEVILGSLRTYLKTSFQQVPVLILIVAHARVYKRHKVLVRQQCCLLPVV